MKLYYSSLTLEKDAHNQKKDQERRVDIEECSWRQE